MKPESIRLGSIHGDVALASNASVKRSENQSETSPESRGYESHTSWSTCVSPSGSTRPARASGGIDATCTVSRSYGIVK